MSIQSEIDRLRQNVSAAFTAIGNKGGTVPNSRVSENLASAIDSIPMDFVKKSRLTVTLASSGWSNLSQTVTASGVTSDSDVIVSPISGNHDAYCEAGVRCTGQASNQLTFSCLEKPSSNLSVNILILKQGGST